MKYSAINDLSLLITDAEEQTAASPPELVPPSGTDAAPAEGAVSAAADTVQSSVEDAAAVATGATEAAADALRAQIDGAADAAAALGLSGGVDAAAIQAQLSGQAEEALAALRSSLAGVGGEGSPFGEAAASVAALQTQLTGQAEQTLATLRESLSGLGLNVDGIGGIGGDADTAEAAAALQAQLTAGAEDALVAIRAVAADIAPAEVLSAIGSGAGGVQRLVGALLEAFPADGDPIELGGRAIAYLVLGGVPLALAINTFRALLPVLTLLLRATLALGAVVAIVTLYDAYAALPPAGQTVAQVAVPLTAVVAVGAVSVNKVTRAVDEKTSAVKKTVDEKASAVKKSVEESPLGAAKLKVSDALESVRKAAAGLGES